MGIYPVVRIGQVWNGERPDEKGFALLGSEAAAQFSPAAAIVKAVIPAEKHRKEPIPHDPEKYQGRNPIEHFFHRLKQFRRMVTRYNKPQGTYLAFVHRAGQSQSRE